ncbi:MAG: 3-dehydroquinate synthase [Gammaproteobacteria bacterium]|nr:3-dehydroquinate synthase [Gammaproteobacteria bacterium]
MPAQIVTVELRERSYPIYIGRDLLADPALLNRCIPGRDLLLVSNTIVAPLYASHVVAALGARRPVEVVLPDGEAQKSLSVVARVIDVLVANRFGRDACVLALGGGVIGDLAGFAAATYQRGIAFVQIPTTLLAQVDSSVGGKTGVNHTGGKNLIGAFHQPSAVIADTRTLESLAPRELRAGLAEVIKYGLICDPEFFAWLEGNLEALLAGDPAALAHAIRRSCEIKAGIVRRDEREQGERAHLNLGHTFGHAIESATGYTGWLHGEAVGAGLMMAADMSQRCGWLRDADVQRVRRLLERAGLPLRAAEVTPAVARDFMSIDKKAMNRRLRLVLLRDIGRACVTADFPPSALEATLSAHFGEHR